MSLFGNIKAGVIEELLQSIVENKASAVLHLRREGSIAEICVSQGEVIRLRHEHTETASLLEELNDWNDGDFQLCLPQEAEGLLPSQIPLPPAIWVVCEAPERRQNLQQAFEASGHRYALLSHIDDLPQLLAKYHPQLLLLEQTQLSLGLTHLAQTPGHQIQVVAVGQPDVHAEQDTQQAFVWLPLPLSVSMIAQKLQLAHIETKASAVATTPPFDPQGFGHMQGTQASTFASLLPLLTHIHQPFSHPETPVQLNTKFLQDIQSAPDSPWKEWLLQAGQKQALQQWLALCPGPAEASWMVVKALVQQGILLDLSDQISGAFQRAPTEQQVSPNFSLQKIVTFGLRGKRKEEWLYSLQELSLLQSNQHPRRHSVPIPRLPKLEQARIPLHSDALLVVYSAMTKQNVKQLLAQVGAESTHFLFYVDLNNTNELQFIADLRRHLLATYQAPDLIMVHDPGMAPPPLDRIQTMLHLSDHKTLYPVQHLDLVTTQKVLQHILRHSVENAFS